MRAVAVRAAMSKRCVAALCITGLCGGSDTNRWYWYEYEGCLESGLESCLESCCRGSLYWSSTRVRLHCIREGNGVVTFAVSVKPEGLTVAVFGRVRVRVFDCMVDAVSVEYEYEFDCCCIRSSTSLLSCLLEAFGKYGGRCIGRV